MDQHLSGALKASLASGSMKEFYKVVEMRNPSRSFFVGHEERLHSLKAVVTYAAREKRASIRSRDFHAADGAQRLAELGFEVVHNPEEEDSAREREWISRLARAGQPEFRTKLIDLYGRCAFSGCTTPAALEAAHVKSVSGRGADSSSNGILLRADLHKLFDAGLIAINPRTGVVGLATDCRADYESVLSNVVFRPPAGGPELTDFAPRWQAFTKRCE